METTNSPVLPAPINLSIGDVQTVGSGFSTYTAYTISVKHASYPEKNITHRYSEFLALHTCLQQALGGYLPDLIKYDFPKKASNKMNATLVAERKVALEKYLAFLASNPLLMNSNFVKRFLDLPMEIVVEHKNKFDQVNAFYFNRLQTAQLLNFMLDTTIPTEKLAPFIPGPPIAISHLLKSPLHILSTRSMYSLNTSGCDGKEGRSGHAGSSGYGHHKLDGKPGQHGGCGEDGQHGENARPITVSLMSDENLSRLTINDLNSKQILFSRDNFGARCVNFQANGGSGGNGGAGGYGGTGASGHQGEKGKPGSNGDKNHPNGSDGEEGGLGGCGGDGGNAGHGGNGGNGGDAANIQIFCHDPRLLIAVRADKPVGGKEGRGGATGQPGQGGKKGEGGPGGPGGRGARYEVKEKYTELDANNRTVEKYKTITKEGNDGRQGPKGKSGKKGRTGAPAHAGIKGRDGRDATVMYTVLDNNGRVLESANSIYHPVLEICASDGDCDGIFAPGDTITFVIRSVFNEGGLTLPAGATLHDEHGNVVATLPHVPPKQMCVLNASFATTVPPRDMPNKAGSFTTQYEFPLTARFGDKPFMEYRPSYTASWPLVINLVSAPSLLTPGDWKPVTVMIGNISQCPYGANSAVQLVVKMPQGLSLAVPPDSVNNGVQKWVMNTTDDLACSFQMAIADNVFSPYEGAKCQIELYWKGMFIEFYNFEVGLVPKWSNYLEGPPADVIVVHDNITSVPEYLAWSKATNQLNLHAYFWDANYYPVDAFVEYFNHVKCSRAVLVFALTKVASANMSPLVLIHLQRQKTTSYTLVTKEMNPIPIEGLLDIGGIVTTFPTESADPRAWSIAPEKPWFSYHGANSSLLRMPIVARLIGALPTFHKLILLAKTLPNLPCYEWTFEEQAILVPEMVSRSLVVDFVTSFQAKDFMSARMVQKMLLEHSDFARNKQVVATILLAIKRVDKMISFFSSDKVWNNVKKCLMDLLALDAGFKKECEAEREVISKRFKTIAPILNSALEIKIK